MIIVQEMSKLDFEIIPADACLLYQEDKSGTCMIIIYVDDILVIGNNNINEVVKTKVEEEFSIKTEYNLTDCLGCPFHINKIRMKGWLGQQSIINSLEKKFGKEVMKDRLGLTPGTPRFVAMRVTEDQDKLGTKEHITDRSGVGTLLYLMKHTRPDLCNTVRELSKTLDKPAPTHLEEIYRIIRYVLTTKR